jgi:5-formyltetrahydrofolate cyclo-ligase
VSLEEKRLIREQVIDLLRKQKKEDSLSKSRRILDKLFALKEFEEAETILFYASFNGEVDTFEMMKRGLQLGKRIALPMIISEDKKIVPALIKDVDFSLETGPYGIKQPKQGRCQSLSPDQIDLVIVPGLAFDRDGHRLGRGAGYYDRFLSDDCSGTPSIGLAYDFQVVDGLPLEPHDQAVSFVISN